MKTVKLSLSLAILITTACGSPSNFKGSAKVGPNAPASDNATPAPDVETTSIETVPQQAADVPPVEVPAEVPALVPLPDPIQIPKVCKEKLEYNPSEILCSLPIDGSQKTAWQSDKWSTDFMANKKATWINPLEAALTGDQAYCPFVPGGEKVVYVANFTLAADEEVTVESTIDDIGQVRLWKNADPKQEAFISVRSHKSNDKVKLAAGFYTIVIDGVDTGKYASGAVASVLNSKGAVIRQTEASSEWCIFRLTVAQDIPEFLLSASACRSCMIGTAAAANVK